MNLRLLKLLTLIHCISFLYITEIVRAQDIFIEPIMKYGYGELTSLAYAPDGKTFLTGTADGKARIWDIESGALIHTLKDQTSPWDEAVYSPNGTHVITIGLEDWYSHNVRFILHLWDIKTGEEIKKFIDHYPFEFSPDGTQLISAFKNECILSDISTGIEINRFNTGNSVHDLTFSPDGTYILIKSYNAIELWNVLIGQKIREFQINDVDIYEISFSLDGEQFLANGDHCVLLYDVFSGEEIINLEFRRSGFLYAIFSPDGKQIMTSKENGKVQLWNIESGLPVKEFGGVGYNNWIKFSPDGKYILINKSGGSQLWDVKTAKQYEYYLGNTPAVFSPDGRYILSNSNLGLIKLYDRSNGQVLKKYHVKNSSVDFVSFSLDGKQVYTGILDDTARIWDTETGIEIDRFVAEYPQGPFVNRFKFSPDGSIIICRYISHDKEILYDTKTGNIIHEFPITDSGIVISPDGEKLLLLNKEYSSLWDLMNGKELYKFKYMASEELFKNAHTGAFSSDNTEVFIGSESGETCRWVVTTGDMIGRYEHYGIFLGLLPNKNQFLTSGHFYYGNTYGIVRIWDIDTGQEIHNFGCDMSVFAISPDGSQLLTSKSNDLYFWDISTGELVLHVYNYNSFDRIDSMTFSPDGTKVLTGSLNGVACLWDISELTNIKQWSLY